MTEHPPWSLLPPPALCKCAGLHSRFWQQPIHAATLRPESRPNAAYGREWCAPRSSMPASRALEELLAVASSSVIAHTGGLPWLCLQCRAVRCRLSSAVCATPIWRRYGVLPKPEVASQYHTVISCARHLPWVPEARGPAKWALRWTREGSSPPFIEARPGARAPEHAPELL